ncbi:MAG: magnesium and cobalt transport protein CorA, partial [Myxococcales bacterium]|nr:magnesium and cobalt transport protein CorA [Myxococcales bacterium]
MQQKQERTRRRGRWGRRPLAGARPGELVLAEAADPIQVQAFDYGPDYCREWQPRLEQLGPMSESVRDGGKLVVRWVDVAGLSDADMLQRLAEAYRIHPLALADIVNVPQRAKVDHYDHNHLLIVHMVRLLANGTPEYEQVSMLVGEGWLLTVQEQPGDVFDPIRTRLREKLGNVRNMGADYLAYALLDAVVDAYFPVAEHLAQ